MSEEELSGLFVIFRRGRNHGTTEGSGIGLAVCKKLVEARGGSISAASIPGEGTCFRLELPLAKTAGDDSSSNQLLIGWADTRSDHA